MEHKIGFTKAGKIIFQNISNGDVKIKDNESDSTSILYPYTEWLKIKDSVADYSTIQYEYNPKYPNKLIEVGFNEDEAEINKKKKEAETKERTNGFIKIVFVITIIILLLGLVRDVFFPKEEK